MAEEIISRWDKIRDLLEELIAPNSHSKRRTFIRFLEVRDPESLKQTGKMRVVDAKGNNVVFPLTLISDTTFEQRDTQKSLTDGI